MSLKVVSARLRIKINGPPLTLFIPCGVRNLWLNKGHEFAETVYKQSIVLDRT